jgi:pyridoxal phosphate enzyme (YggS family)
MTIQESIQEIKNELPNNVQLVAVSKFHPLPALQAAYEGGQRIFGESRVQELCEKFDQMPSDVEWHFIGHLQTNKVKYIASFISLIHAVDSWKLLEEIERQAAKHKRVVRCLLQLHVAQEETKFGFTPEELLAQLQEKDLASFPHVQVAGLMCMASNVDDEVQIQQEFHAAHETFHLLQQTVFKGNPAFRELSMGMSHDYHIALREGSTLVRIGTRIFGNRY